MKKKSSARCRKATSIHTQASTTQTEPPNRAAGRSLQAPALPTNSSGSDRRSLSRDVQILLTV